ncbi:hypothetical protein [Flavobacterium sp. CS20]|uniref:hypothetical protein n=1 Tax=Flavobacterium sp. CS20 TaxID=2775246 RepID=UPI001B3A1CF4|nr:hypothetical protein [Flavobacterium sp. CS20]QTY27867.1 hypothetical protein IGB25_04980 [Flavobacterium sp. CS20]
MGIPNAQAGEFYIIVITNFSQNQGFISFEQTNENDPGAGTTSCSILGDDIDACEDETVTVFTNVPGGDTFEWALLNTNTGNFDVLTEKLEAQLISLSLVALIRSRSLDQTRRLLMKLRLTFLKTQ